MNRLSWLRQRTRWRATWKDREARWRGTPDGRVGTVFRNQRGPGWCWCLAGDGSPVFIPGLDERTELREIAQGD
jgi:hypothetical protein